VNDLQRRERLEAIFREHSRAVSAYALRRIDPASAEETVSEVFTTAWRRLEELPPDALPWLLACARRVLANQRRSHRRRVALADRLNDATPRADTQDPASSAMLGDRALARALAELSEDDRELLLLMAWEELEPERLARTLGCSRRTLAVRLHRARRRLALALERVEREALLPTTTLEPLT
jgi:RNA polymerase sigma-70 factor, ECF subfamily